VAGTAGCPLAFLITLEPVVCHALLTLAVLGLRTHSSSGALGTPHLPFLGLIGRSIGCTVLLIPYQALMRALSE
jgi:hypothetical protein